MNASFPSSSSVKKIWRRLGPVLAAGALLAACRDEDGSRSAAASTQTIEHVEVLPEDAARQGPRVVSSAERFGYTAAGATPMPADGAASAGLPAGHPPLAAAPSPAAGDLAWTAPAGWREAPERPMRVVTFWPGDDEKTECYVSRLDGPGGGVASNINRWRGQMQQPPLDETALAGLEKIEVLGQAAPLVAIEGEYAGMAAGPAQPGYALLGTVVALDARTVFVKMVGPADAVKAQRERFVEFCRSLRAQ